MKPKTQIAYIPNHAHGDINHEDVEFGFVTSSNEKFIFCRFWSKTYPNTLRTMSCSEAVYGENLVEVESVPQSLVNKFFD